MNATEAISEYKKQRLSHSMGFKFIIVIIMIISITALLSATYLHKYQSQQLIQNQEEKIKSLGRYISLVIPEDILAYDFESLNNYMYEISLQKDIIYGVVYAPDGKNMTSFIHRSDPFVSTALKKYHNGDIKKTIKILNQERDVHYKTFPVNFNDKQYATLQLGYTTRYINEDYSSTLSSQIIYAILVILILSISLYFVFVIQILRPGKLFLEEFKSMGEGKANNTLSIKTNNEFDTLSTSFNQMAKKINSDMKELIKAKVNSDKANKAKSDFLSRMSHELRTPLNAILGFSQLLTLEDITPRQNNHVKEVLKAGDHLLALINEILDISSIERGDISLYPAPVSLDKLIDEAWTMLNTAAIERDIELIKDYDKSCIHSKLFVDQLRAKQVLINLLSNAIKYNHIHGKIWVQCRVVNNSKLEIAIRDNGIGISDKNLDVIFKYFERGDISYHSVDGTGIGLSLSKTLVEKMGGNIKVNSTEGTGSTFFIELPLADTTTLDSEYKTPDRREESKNQDSQLEKRVVLYIEDNTQNWIFLKTLFERWPNVDLILANTGNEGVELSTRYLPDLILLDIQLPDIDGYEVFKQLSSNSATQAIPVVAVSANVMQENVLHMGATGFHDYLTKPLDVKQLISVVEKILWKKVTK